MNFLSLTISGIIFASGIPVFSAEPNGTPSSLLREAEMQADQGDHAAAAQSLARAAEESPGEEAIQFRLAAEFVYLKKFDEAALIFSRLAGSKNPRMAAMAQNSLAALREEQIRSTDYDARVARMQAQQTRQDARQSARRTAQRAREREFRRKEADQQARQAIYDLFAAGETKLGLERFTAYEAGQTVPVDLRYAAIFALLREGRATEAVMALEALPPAERETPEWFLARGRTERALGQSGKAWRDFDTARRAAAGTPLEVEAGKEIRALPMEANLDRWAWGELQLDAVHLFRFSDTIFYGRVREGTFVPGARWIQPFVQADFTLDTNSGVTDGVSQVFANNLAGVHAGVRIWPFANESIWIYGMAGIQKDLRGTTRFDGAWFFDWRVGVRGYKGIGPGLTFASDFENGSHGLPGLLEMTPRAAWFVEGGADAAFYSLYENFIAYYEAREGFRVLDVGSRLGFDLYALQQGTVDSRGLYFNNFFEVGAGVRATARIQPGVSVITRVETVGGAYLGRNEENSRGDLGKAYGDVRITVSLWAEW